MQNSFRDKLTVFISSKMTGELKGIRPFVDQKLRERGIEPFVFELSAGSLPDNPMEVSIENLKKARVYLAVFGHDLGEGTKEEFHVATKEGKPRFVYLIGDERTARDQDLTTFLLTCVMGLGRDVTWRYIADITQIADDAAESIWGWLVREYDRLRAQGKTQEADDLQRTATEPLKNPLSHLESRLRSWLEVLGYRVVTQPGTTEHFQLVARRGTNREVLIVGAQGEGMLGHLSCLEAALQARGSASEGWLITTRPAGPAVQTALANRNPNHVPIQCWTFDRLVENAANVAGYLDWLEGEVLRRGVNQYIPLACSKDEFDFESRQRLGRSEYGEEHGWVDGYIDRWLEAPTKEHVSILGEFGTGKSWFALHYAGEICRRYRAAMKADHNRPRLPLVISLRDFSSAEQQIEKLVANFLDGTRGIKLDYAAFEQLNRMERLLLIFDGFDEMAMKDRRPDAVMDHFWELARVAQAGAKVILTCRAEHFLNNERGREFLRGELDHPAHGPNLCAPRFEILNLEMFDDRQVEQVLEKRLRPDDVRLVLKDPLLREEARRPVMADFIVHALDDIKQGRPANDLAHIYLYAVRRNLERLAPDKFQSLSDKLFFFCELSWHMLASGQMTVRVSEFPPSIREHFAGSDFDPLSGADAQSGPADTALFIRNARGDYTPTHRSLIEFFAAYKLVAELDVLATDFKQLAQGPQMPQTDRRSEQSPGGLPRHAPAPSDESLIRIDALTPNAISFAAQMVDRTPVAIERMCRLCWEPRSEGRVVWNAQGLLPFLCDQNNAIEIAKRLIAPAADRPLPFGVPWILGELGRQSVEVARDPQVRNSLIRTAEAFRREGREYAHPAWQASFALMKLGEFGHDDEQRDRNFEGPIDFLIEKLPPELDMARALDGLARTLKAVREDESQIDQRDVIALVREAKRDWDVVITRFSKLLDSCQLARDKVARRAYFMVWLCGYLQLEGAVDRIVDAMLSRTDSVCTCSAEALGKIGKRTTKVVQALENMLQHNYYRARHHAALSLADLEASESVPALEASIRWERVQSVRESMIKAKEKIVSSARRGH